MKRTLSIGLLAAVSLVSPVAFPCGAPFGTGINVDPKQDIVVVHKDGVETYVFQPRFCGTASEFGLILPVPSQLSSAPSLSKPYVFNTADMASKPEYRTQTVCNSKGTTGYASADGGSRNGGGAVVVSSGTVGFMEYSQLKADSPASFTDWLDKNGYPHDSLASSAFSYYVDKGWYFVAFKISQGTVPSGTMVCKDLGPVKLSFPSEVPVVPSRMATARSRDTSGSLAYASTFDWRIFGITKGTEQIGFANGANSQRTLGFSGIFPQAQIPYIDDLAAAGDRLVKLTLTFPYGSTEPDIALSLGAGVDYREVVTTYSYISCAEPDAGAGKDTAPSKKDAGVPPDAEVVKPGQADAGGPSTTENNADSGCSMATGATGHGLASLLVLALALALRRRSRRG